MSRRDRPVGFGGRLQVPMSTQALELLEQLARLGIYGNTVDEVARRFIDQGLERFVITPLLPQRRRKP